MKLSAKSWMTGGAAALALCGTLLSGVAVAGDEAPKGKVPVLELDGPILERKNPMASLLGGSAGTTLEDIRANLEKAAADEDVTALVVKLGNPAMGMAQLNELHFALCDFEESGKDLIVATDYLTLGKYLLAAPADHIVLPELGRVEIYGISLDMYFYAGLLEKIGAKADVVQIGKFKNAMEAFTNTGMSEGTRIQMTRILDDLNGFVSGRVAEVRGMEADEALAKLMDGPYSAAEALEIGLVTDVEYIDDFLVSYAEDNAVEFDFDYMDGTGGKSTTASFNFMELFMGGGAKGAKTRTTSDNIAVVHASGPIIDGRAQQSLFGNEEMIASEDFLDLLEEVYDNEGTRAIVLRVDSPGGSANASDRIWNRLREFSEVDGIPVVVSMGNVAASGGYYISMGADHIIAEPMTITGSIGVIGGRLVFPGTYDKIGVTKESIRVGKHAGLFDELKVWTPEERAFFEKTLLDIYDVFTAKAAEGRGMSQEQIKELGGGRVWTGIAALENGLVDELGSLELAIERARELAELPADTPVLEYPRELTLPEVLEKLFSGQVSVASGVGTRTAAVPDFVQGIAALLPERHAVTLWAGIEMLRHEPGVLLYDPVAFEIR